RTCRDDWHGHDIAKPLAVSARNAVAGLYFGRKNLQLLEQNSRLDGVETRSKADANIVVFIAAVSMHAQTSERVCHPIVVGHASTAGAITTERLCGKETGRGGVTKGAQPTVVVRRAKALRGIIENQQAFGLGRNRNGTVVSRQAEQINRDE